MLDWILITQENRTKYRSCYQGIRWVPEVIAGYQTPSGFIVQFFTRTSLPEDPVIKNTLYYEAWKVENGVCIDTVELEFDDLFAIGHPLSPLDTFKDSLNKSGIFKFTGDVFWVDKNNDHELYNIVESWPVDEVPDACGLRAVYSSNEFAFKKPKFTREPFVHEWNMETDEIIYSIAKNTLFTAYPNPANKRDQSLFKEVLDDIFPENKQKLKKVLLDEWKSQLSANSV